MTDLALALVGSPPPVLPVAPEPVEPAPVAVPGLGVPAPLDDPLVGREEGMLCKVFASIAQRKRVGLFYSDVSLSQLITLINLSH